MSDLLLPPKVELKYPLSNFQDIVYPILKNPLLDVKQRELLFSLVHGIYRKQGEIEPAGKADDPQCQNQA